MIKDELLKALALHIPKLTKQQLSELLFVVTAWVNGIPHISITRERKSIEGIDSDLRSLGLLNQDLEQKNYILASEYKEQCDRVRNQDETLKRLVAENRALKNRVFMSTGVKN